MELQQKVREYFFKNANVDVLYVTSDGTITPDKEEAEKKSAVLPDTKVETFYNDINVRNLAKQHALLAKMVHATDYIKLWKHKVLKNPSDFKMPTYPEYVLAFKAANYDVVSEEAYNFITDKVVRSNKPLTVGQRDTIFTFRDGIVNAFFLRRYPEGQIFQYQDRIIFTCPTNTELVSGSYFDLFGAILAPKKGK